MNENETTNNRHNAFEIHSDAAYVGDKRIAITDNIEQNVIYSELKSLKDSGKLNTGCWYRVTDYVTTTGQSDTDSARHKFDIILLALSENTLSHEGFVAQNANDSYFDNSDF